MPFLLLPNQIFQTRIRSFFEDKNSKRFSYTHIRHYYEHEES